MGAQGTLRGVPPAAVTTALVRLVALALGLAAASVDAPVRPEEGEIVRLYRSALGRDPDPDGYRYWVTSRIEGVPLAIVAASFLAGPEFGRRFGTGNDPVFVDRVYTNVLGRPGEPAGVAYWSGELDRGLDRVHLVLLFSESAELRRRTGTELADLPAYRPVVRPVRPAEVAVSWRPGCPVGPDDLRAVEVDHVDGRGQHRRGVLVVNRDVADGVARIFGRLYRARFPIVSIRPVDEFAGGADPGPIGAAAPDPFALDRASMEADNTSAFLCRPVTGGTGWSRHAWGRAVDLNPVENPYVAGSEVLPAAGRAWVDRSRHHPAMIRPGDVVTSAFAAEGWRWGGDFRTVRDYQHFQR
jgi:poly-gamma-glutamate synthesis protein (capsule biosynthesis protein)